MISLTQVQKLKPVFLVCNNNSFKSPPMKDMAKFFKTSLTILYTGTHKMCITLDLEAYQSLPTLYIYRKDSLPLQVLQLLDMLEQS